MLKFNYFPVNYPYDYFNMFTRKAARFITLSIGYIYEHRKENCLGYYVLSYNGNLSPSRKCLGKNMTYGFIAFQGLLHQEPPSSEYIGMQMAIKLMTM